MIRSHRREGYTLFQLLILLALLLMLAGMFAPAAFQMLVKSRNIHSQNNLKQIGLALHNYHDTNNRLPAGVNDKHFSTFAHVLPFIEQDAVFKRIDFTKAADSDDNAAMRMVHIKLFMSDLDPVRGADEKIGSTSYMMVAGSKADLQRNDGMFFRDSEVRITEVTDGLSNTLMAVETLKGDGSKKAESVARQHVRLKKADLAGAKEETGVKDFKDGKNIAGNRGSSWMDGRFLQATTTITREFNSERPDVDCEGAGGLAAPRSLEKGTNVLFGDGSVRFLADSVPFTTWQALATRAGGEVVNIE